MYDLTKDPRTGEKILKGNRTTDEYLHEVYVAHKSIIDRGLGKYGETNPERLFTNRVKGLVSKEYPVYVGRDRKPIKTINQALKLASRQEEFTPQEEFAQEFIFNEVDDGAVKRAIMQDYRDERGRFQKFDYNKVQWQKRGKFWTYDGKYKLQETQDYSNIFITVTRLSDKKIIYSTDATADYTQGLAQ